MGLDLQKINVKFYLAEGTLLEPEEAFRTFSKWIPETPDEVLIDVADYGHLPRGPKTVLVGYEANYVLDDTDGRPGLRYARKRPVTGQNLQRLHQAVAATLRACHRLESTTSDAPGPRFLANEILIVVNDRLRAAADDDTFEAVKADLEALAGRLFSGDTSHVERIDDGTGRLAVRLRADGKHTVEELIANLG